MRAMSTLLESWACQEPEIIQRTISIGFEDRVSAIIEDFSFAALVALLTKDCAVPTCQQTFEGMVAEGLILNLVLL